MALLETLGNRYSVRFDKYEQLRNAGSTSYALFSSTEKYFLRVIKPALFDTAITGAGIQMYLQNKAFPVPRVICTKDNFPYFIDDEGLHILYEYIEGTDSVPERDAEEIGALVGRMHLEMKSYHGKLVKRDKHFYIGRYTAILEGRSYSRAGEFAAYGDALYERIKDLPRGYCHGDMYDGNIRKASDGKLYIHDFDTSCEGFPMYDITLFCDKTEYFKFDERNYSKSNGILARFLPEYRKFHTIKQAEIEAFHDLIAVQHFSTQATIMELFGHNCLSDAELDGQLDWLYRWREQCEKEAVSNG